MVKQIGNVIMYLVMWLGIIFGLAMFLSCILYIFTPHLTKYNEETDIYKYWFSNTYFCKNFDCPNNLDK